MNKAAIKKFAVESRQKLIKSTIERLEELGITDKDVVEVVELGGVYSVKSQTLTEIEKKHRDIILSIIQEKGYESFVEEIAYTWFNRIIAIRYMEVNDYLPFRTRVLSSEIPGKVDPDLMTEIADHIDELELNRDKIITLKETHQQEELFKYVFIKVCNYLGQFLPVMFEQIADYTELLLPNVMITKGSVIQDMIELVPEEDWTNQVEIIGWLYQYYISEKKDQVFADLKKNKKITKENIPAATQLFTPEWIVKYMVENSLGRLWLEGHPNEELKSKWKYYLEEAEQEESVQFELNKIKKESEVLTPEDLTIIDPAMGSGHILVYAFDILYQIYQSEGYSEKEIPRLILEKNIHGLDIDDRAGQLAYFALLMKARAYYRRFFRDIEKNHLELNICSIQESNNLILDMDCINLDNHEIKNLVNLFKDAKGLGSILNLNHQDIDIIQNVINFWENKFVDSLESEKLQKVMIKLKKLMVQYKMMSKKYHVCVTNPPYMGRRKSIDSNLGQYLDHYYEIAKMDMFAVFILKCSYFTKKNGYVAMMTPYSWMFINSFNKLREYMVTNKCIINLIQLEESSFEDATVPICSFVFRNSQLNYNGDYIRLSDFPGVDIQKEKVLSAIIDENVSYRYKAKMEKFKKVPDKRISYWITENMENTFEEYSRLGDIIDIKQGITTSDNERFLRLWHEVNFESIGIEFSRDVALISFKKWFPYSKGGAYRKWYGNNEYIINYYNNGQELKEFHDVLNKTNPGGRLKNREFYFLPSITWSDISGTTFGARINKQGFLFDVKGSCAFPEEDMYYYILGILNSKLICNYIEILNPTVTTQVGDLKQIPLKVQKLEKIDCLCTECIEIATQEWNSYEISWDFKKHPLILSKENSIKKSFIKWEIDLNKAYTQLKLNEEELNHIFINIYGLEKEVTAEIDDECVTFRKANREREIKSLISYAVGCTMGRYSLDEEGLIYAGGEFDMSKYQTFKADDDGIILISDNEYFEDDLLNKFVEFVKVVYGPETLEENLNFITDTECFKRKATESSRDCLRRYFLKGFMEDHLKVYQKRPIYWQFDSGKQNGFKALIYMHRYDENMVAKVRTDYLHPLQRKYEAELERLDHLINFENISTVEKGKAKKRQEQIYKQIDECKEYDLLLAHVAHQRIPLDLDDGVKVNYQKFQNIELTSEGSSKVKKGDLLYKVKM